MEAEQQEWTHVGEFQMQCPCGTDVGIGVLAKFSTDDEGAQIVLLEPDMTEAWAHSWTHEGKSS